MYVIQENEIKSLIGEATEYDKKQSLGEKEPRSWLKSVSAFANGIGGSLIFGIVDKTNEVVGLTDPEGDSEKISRFLRDKMDPIPPCCPPLRYSGQQEPDHRGSPSRVRNTVLLCRKE